MINWKTICIGICKPLTGLDEAGELLLGVAGKANIYVTIAGIAMIVLGKIFHIFLTSLVAVKETVPELIGYDPQWLRKMSIEGKEERDVRLRNRINRETVRIKTEWMAKFGTDEAIEAMLKKAREKDGLRKES